MGIWDLIIWIGVIRISYSILSWLYFNCYGHINIENYKYGWVVITGASDGIGKAIAMNLAQRGFKLVLIARNKDKLEDVTKEISKATSNSSIKYIVADFAYSHRSPEQFYSDLMKEISVYDVSVLINNVGVLDLAYLAEQNLDKIENMLGVNIYPQTLLSYYMIPKFMDRFNTTKQKSLMINFSSTADLVTIPTSSVYTATKRYNEFLSEGVRYEYGKAIDVATVKPGVVHTNMTDPKKGHGYSALPLTAEVNSYANYLLNHLHKGINYGHWKHSIIVFFGTMFPHQITTQMIKIFFPYMEKYIPH